MLSLMTNPQNTVVKMKSGSTFTAPTSWQIDAHQNHIALTDPENDLSVFFMEMPLSLLSLTQIATQAFQTIIPQFNLKPSQEISPPTSGNWERIFQVVYDVPAHESRMVIATIRTFKQSAYVCLVDGKIAGMSRRGAEVNIMFETWKPVGFEAIEKTLLSAKDWTQADREYFAAFVNTAMEKLEIPGAAIAIIRQDGTIVLSQGFGVKQHGSDNPITMNTPFMIGSISKPLTSLLMAALVDQRKLNWDTLITDILPDFKLADRELTLQLNIRHTVSASTGMPQGGLACLFKYENITPEDRLAEMQDMQPTTKIGETFQYSNYLIMAGGYAAARAHSPHTCLEAAYARAMQDCIFDPMQMKNTVIKIDDALLRSSAFPHGVDFDGRVSKLPLGLEKFAYSLAPAGAIWSTVQDLCNYLLVEMNKGVFNGKRIISEASILERRKTGIRMGEKSSYGLGLFLSHEQGLDMVGHGGNTIGFSSDLCFIPEKGIGIVILTNKYIANPFLAAVKQKFLEITFQVQARSEDILSFAITQRDAALKKKHATISRQPTATTWIESLIGDYSNSKLGPAKLLKTADGAGYELQFLEWKSSLATEVETNGNKLLVLVDPPSYGGIKLQVQENGSRLVLELGQEKETFSRIYVNEDIVHGEPTTANKLTCR